MPGFVFNEAEDEPKRKRMELALMYIERAQTPSFELRKEMLHAPPRVGLYTLWERIGQGAFGKVFRATREGKLFAIKVIDARKLRARFYRHGLDHKQELWREVETLGRLRHSFIVRLEEAFWEGERLCIVTELLAKPADSLELVHARQLVEAVEYLHDEVGIAHGDIKPPNVMIDMKGAVRLIDFNSSRPLGEGNLPGTPAFHPPEAKAAKAGNFAAADVWALGETLQKLLPMEDPSARRIVEMCLQPLAANRPSPSELLSLFPK